MKASHFVIGNPEGSMTNPKPIQPVEPTVKIGFNFNVDDAKKMLREASWTVGCSLQPAVRIERG